MSRSIQYHRVLIIIALCAVTVLGAGVLNAQELEDSNTIDDTTEDTEDTLDDTSDDETRDDSTDDLEDDTQDTTDDTQRTIDDTEEDTTDTTDDTRDTLDDTTDETEDTLRDDSDIDDRESDDELADEEDNTVLEEDEYHLETTRDEERDTQIEDPTNRSTSTDQDVTRNPFEERGEDQQDSVVQRTTEQKDITEQRSLIQQGRRNNVRLRDTDGDGITDYDEQVIYQTDPTRRSTHGATTTDGEMLRQGRDPTTGERIQYQDPRAGDKAERVAPDTFAVMDIELTGTSSGQTQLTMRGFGPPLSYITIYIFSTPVVVTVRTDETGQWRYTLDEELENGEHEIYTATVNNKGKIVAQSEGAPFVKTANAATLGAVSPAVSMGVDDWYTFFMDNMFLVLLLVAVLVLLVGVFIVGVTPLLRR